VLKAGQLSDVRVQVRSFARGSSSHQVGVPTDRRQTTVRPHSIGRVEDGRGVHRVHLACGLHHSLLAAKWQQNILNIIISNTYDHGASTYGTEGRTFESSGRAEGIRGVRYRRRPLDGRLGRYVGR